MEGSEFIRVVTKDGEECFVLTTLKDHGKAGFELTVCHGTNVWTGTVDKDDLDALCKKLKMEYKRFVDETVEALTSTSDTKESFQYQLKRSKAAAEFVWKKYIPSEDIAFQLGSATLHNRADSAEYISKMFNYCIKRMEELKDRIHVLETDNERISQERLNALKRLEKCVVAKEDLENDLYSKFSLVLNSKKEKIRQLKRQVEEGILTPRQQESEDDVKSSVVSSKGLTLSHQETKPDHSDSGQDTDEDKPIRKRRKVTQKAVTSIGDESLDLGVEEEGEDKPSAVVTRPRRQAGPQKKQTPSKPVLPRVGSNEPAAGSAKKTRMKKGSSSGSNKSMDNVDSEDLLHQL